MALTDWQTAEIKVAADKYLGKRNQEIAAQMKMHAVHFGDNKR